VKVKGDGVGKRIGKGTVRRRKTDMKKHVEAGRRLLVKDLETDRK